MTRRRGVRNFAASVHQRLLNHAREIGMDFNVLLQQYAGERFLFRLGASSQVDRFTLKGAALFRVWAAGDLRPTRDINFLGEEVEDDASLRAAIKAICDVPCPEDGVVFDPGTIRIDTIRGEQVNGGLRVRIHGRLGQARLSLQVDIGFGDVITPRREEQDYPTLLDQPAPRIWTYPRETLVAEKLVAMVQLGPKNSRVKDLWDVACLARRFAFDGETLRTSIAGTFCRRRTAFGRERPEALLPSFYEDTIRARRWTDLRRQVGVGPAGPASLKDVGEELRHFLGPVYDSLIEGRPFTKVWPSGGPWQPGVRARRKGEER